MRMHRRLYFLVFLLWFMAHKGQCQNGQRLSAWTRLSSDLLDASYDVTESPSSNSPTDEPLNINVTYFLKAILEVNEPEQILKMRSGFLLTWKDSRLSWSPQDHSGISSIILPLSAVWTPLLWIENTMETHATIPPDPTTTYVSISNQGLVTMDTGLVHATTCIFNLINFPFDVQNCHVIIKAQNADSDQVLLSPSRMSNQAGDKHPQWDIEEMRGTSLEMSSGSSSLSAVDITIRLSRLPMFYVQNIILPILLFGLIGLGCFMVPLKSGERASVGVSVVLGITIFQIVLSDVLPTTSRADEMPILFSYASKSLLVLVAFTTASFFTINISYLSGNLRSKFARILFFKVLAVVVLLGREGRCNLQKYSVGSKVHGNHIAVVSSAAAGGENGPKAKADPKKTDNNDKCEYTDMELLAAILDRLFFVTHAVVLIAISVEYALSISSRETSSFTK